MTSKSHCWFLLLLLCFASSHADETFPLPPELQPDVDFWVSIFSHYKTDEGVLHDNRNLAVVYESIPMPANLSRRERDRRVEARRKQLQSVLKSLAAGKRDNLSDEESRVLAQWPADVSNATLAVAVTQIRYQQGLKERFREGLIRSGRWRDHIEREFRALGVPIELAALPHVESSYNPDARSSVGASGIWQFTRSTGSRFMRIDHVLDERNDPFDATRAAGKLLAYNYSIAGNWPMAITAYNHGLAGARRAMKEFGDTAYVDIMRKYKGRTFGFASRNFYVAFMAAKHIDQNQQRYFPGLVAERPVDYVTSALPAYVQVSDLTKSLGVTSAVLREHNMAVQATVWQGSKLLPKGYLLRVPAYATNASTGQLFDSVPGDKWQSSQLPDLFHTVVRGDTLSEIADTYRTRVSTLVALNSLDSSNRIRAGQKLRLPAAGPAPVVVAAAKAPAIAPAEVPVAAVAPDEGPIELATVAALPAEDEAAPAEIEEVAPAAMGDDLVASVRGAIQTALLSDPSDYSVATDGTIEVQPLETLGHYGDWLEIRTQRLRDINRMAFKTPVEVGKRIKLDTSVIDAAAFEARRVAYHQAQQDSFFRQHLITGTTTHVIRAGESVWVLALRQYDVPVWLLRQYNPEVDMSDVRPGTTINIPILTTSDQL